MSVVIVGEPHAPDPLADHPALRHHRMMLAPAGPPPDSAPSIPAPARPPPMMADVPPDDDAAPGFDAPPGDAPAADPGATPLVAPRSADVLGPPVLTPQQVTAAIQAIIRAAQAFGPLLAPLVNFMGDQTNGPAFVNVLQQQLYAGSPRLAIEAAA